MNSLAIGARPLRACIVIVLLVASAVGLMAARANAVGNNAFLACGYANVTGAPAVSTSGCTTLADALTSARPASVRHSATAIVSVAQLVHATLSDSKVKAGKTVRRQRLVSGKWKSLSISAKIKLQTLPNHKKVVGYVRPCTPTSHGKLKLRVTRSKTSTNAAGTSKRLKLTVT
jgi:hypothetical protein